MKKNWMFLVGVFVLFMLSCAVKQGPTISDTRVHREYSAKKKCLVCHLYGDSWTPRIPHDAKDKNWKNCVECHK